MILSADYMEVSKVQELVQALKVAAEARKEDRAATRLANDYIETFESLGVGLKHLMKVVVDRYWQEIGRYYYVDKKRQLTFRAFVHPYNEFWTYTECGWGKYVGYYHPYRGWTYRGWSLNDTTR